MNKEIESNLKQQFTLFSGQKNTIALTQLNKWFKQADIFDEIITLADTERSFGDLSSKRIDYESFMNLLNSLFETKNCALGKYLEKLVSCGPPGPKKMIHIVKVKRMKKHE